MSFGVSKNIAGLVLMRYKHRERERDRKRVRKRKRVGKREGE